MADYTEYLNDGLNLQDATTGPGYFLTVNDGITLSATSVETRLNETIADTIAISTTSSETANNTQLNTDSLAINDAGVSENLISTAIATFDGLSLSTTSPNIQSYAAWLAVNDGFGLSSFANNQIYNPYTQTDYFAVSGTGSKQGFTESSPAAFTVTDVISYTQHPLEIQVASLSGTYYGCVREQTQFKLNFFRAVSGVLAP